MRGSGSAAWRRARAALASSSGVSNEREEFMELVEKDIDRLEGQLEKRGVSMLFSRGSLQVGRGRAGWGLACVRACVPGTAASELLPWCTWRAAHLSQSAWLFYAVRTGGLPSHHTARAGGPYCLNSLVFLC